MVFMLAGCSLCTAGNVHGSLLSPGLKNNRELMRSPVLIAEGLNQGCKMPGSEGLLLPAVPKGKER